MLAWIEGADTYPVTYPVYRTDVNEGGDTTLKQSRKMVLGSIEVGVARIHEPLIELVINGLVIAVTRIDAECLLNVGKIEILLDVPEVGIRRLWHGG